MRAKRARGNTSGRWDGWREIDGMRMRHLGGLGLRMGQIREDGAETGVMEMERWLVRLVDSRTEMANDWICCDSDHRTGRGTGGTTLSSVALLPSVSFCCSSRVAHFDLTDPSPFFAPVLGGGDEVPLSHSVGAGLRMSCADAASPRH